MYVKVVEDIITQNQEHEDVLSMDKMNNAYLTALTAVELKRHIQHSAQDTDQRKR
jgi:hypothetical protein